MDRQTIVLTTDKRQEKLVDLLEGKKSSYAWELDARGKEASEKIYVLPIPVTKLDKNTMIKEKLKQELTNASCKGISIKVFGGGINEEWMQFLSSYQIPYWDFMKLPEVVEGNAWITAEATVAEVLQQSDVSIYGQKVLVAGYGCCGEKIAKLFARLGARVTVAARRAVVREQIATEGFEAVSFEELEKSMANVSTIINTVPAMVLTEDCIRKLSHEAVIIDIASKPGGTDFEAAHRYGIRAKLALGLPGIYTTSSSALLLKNAISKYAPLQENVRGDQLWIFQIII